MNVLQSFSEQIRPLLNPQLGDEEKDLAVHRLAARVLQKRKKTLSPEEWKANGFNYPLLPSGLSIEKIDAAAKLIQKKKRNTAVLFFEFLGKKKCIPGGLPIKTCEGSGRALLEALKQGKYHSLVPTLEAGVNFKRLPDQLKGAIITVASDHQFNSIVSKIYPLMNEETLQWAIDYACQLQDKMKKIDPSFSSRAIHPLLKHREFTQHLANDAYKRSLASSSSLALLEILDSRFGNGLPLKILLCTLDYRPPRYPKFFKQLFKQTITRLLNQRAIPENGPLTNS